jgi:hypothetical protein
VRQKWSGPAREMLPFLFAAALWLAPLSLHPTSVAFWRGGAYSDLLISHWPNAILLHRGVFDFGRIPLWNPSILSGTPFAADPLSGMWYLPNWLAVLFPSAIAFNVLFWLHLGWAGWGAARLAKAEGLGHPGALIAGLAFAGTPKLIGHIGLGHLGLTESVCWTPWLLLSAGGAARSLVEGDRAWVRESLLSGVILGVIFLADPRWSVPAAMVGAVYAAACVARSHKESRKTPSVARVVGGAALTGTFALGISAGLAIPLWEFLHLSTRAGLSEAQRVAFALPLDHLGGFILPDFGGWPEWVAYPGITVIVLAALGFAENKGRAIFWWCVTLGALLLSLGPSLPVYPAAASLIPGLSLLRVPARFLFLVPLGLAVPAGFGLRAVLGLRQNARSHREILWIGVISVVLISLFAGLSMGPSAMSEPLARARSYTGIILALLDLAWLGLMLRGTVGTRVGMAGWLFLLCVDLGLMSITSLRVVPRAQAVGQGDGLVEWIAQLGDDRGRILSPSYSLPQPAAMYAGLELADGIDPLQIESYRDYMAWALGFSTTDYSVTLPPFPEGDPAQVWAVAPDSQRLGLLSVAYIVSEYPLQADGFTPVTGSAEAYVYRNENARPRAWVQAATDEGSDWTPVERLQRAVDEQRIRATGPGVLVTSEIDYPGWRATIDGVPVKVENAFGILRGVELPAGTHDVVFEFRPSSVYFGAGTTLVFLLAAAWAWIKR